MRKVDSVFPKRKNASVGATVGKGHSRVAKKSKDALTETHEGVSSKATASLGAAASQPAALIASGSEDVYGNSHTKADGSFLIWRKESGVSQQLSHIFWLET
jgi:hypothetical protein